MKTHDDLTFNEIGATMAYYDLTFNVIGATMAHDNLTFNVIGATMEGPLQNPLLAYISQEFGAIKRDCLKREPLSRLIVFRLRRGWVGGQQAHLSSGPLRLC